MTSEDELASKPEVLSAASRRSYAGHAKGYLEYTPHELAGMRRAYYAMVTLVDDEVGRILTAVEDEGLADNTIVVFSSDHGEMLGDHQLMLKGPMMYDCAVRVPLTLRWPDVLPAGQRIEDLVQWIDLAPTYLQAAGVDLPATYQGQSLMPLAKGEEDAASRGWALCQYRDSGHAYDPAVHVTMLRQGQHKLIVYHGSPTTARSRTGELYNLQADSSELNNLWDDETCAPVRMRLTELLTDVVVAIEDRSRRRISHW